MVEGLLLDSPVGQLSISAPDGYLLQGAEWIDNGVLAHTIVDTDVHHCPVCGRSGVRRYGRGPVGILDAPSGGVRARMIVARQRVDCTSCNILSREHLPNVSEGHRFTNRCATWMCSQFELRSNVAIGAVLGLHNKSVRLFAAENGVATGRPRHATATAECASCLRLFDFSAATASHITASSRAPPVDNGIMLCGDCTTNADGRWIKRA
jgi:hypothetical protein